MKCNDFCLHCTSTSTFYKRYLKAESSRVSLLPAVCHLGRTPISNTWGVSGQSGRIQRNRRLILGGSNLPEL